MTRIGILYFHQGWTDIINCLSLINHYCKLYDTIYEIDYMNGFLDYISYEIKRSTYNILYSKYYPTKHYY